MSKKKKNQKKGGNKKELIELITAIIELIIAVLTHFKTFHVYG